MFVYVIFFRFCLDSEYVYVFCVRKLLYAIHVNEWRTMSIFGVYSMCVGWSSGEITVESGEVTDLGFGFWLSSIHKGYMFFGEICR